MDLISKLNAGVKKNTSRELFKIPYLDSLNITNYSKIISINGSNDTLKTRICLYLARNLIAAGENILYIVSSQESKGMFSLELGEYARHLPIMFENNIDRIETMLNALPSGTHVFIDSIVGLFTYNSKYIEKPYLYLGNILGNIKAKKRIYLYVQSGYNGFTHTPLSKIFSENIDVTLTIKKVKSPVKQVVKVGSLYQNQVMGYYYAIRFDANDKTFTQLCYGQIRKGLNQAMFKFFYDYANGEITKVKNTYFKNGEKLGTKLRSLLESYSG